MTFQEIEESASRRARELSKLLNTDAQRLKMNELAQTLALAAGAEQKPIKEQVALWWRFGYSGDD